MPDDRICSVTGVPFSISDAEASVIARLTEANPHFRQPIPLPTVHPVEVTRQIHTWVNVFHLYKTKSALSGVPVITRYNPRLPYRVVSLDEYWNEVDNREFGRDYDFTRPFFEQFDELVRATYLVPLVNVNTQQSEFANGVRNLKDCYLCFSSIDSEDCLYCFHQVGSRSNVLCVGAFQCELCYSCCDVRSCYGCQHCRDSVGCNDCVGCVDCRGCTNCIGCIGLQHATYAIFNRVVGKEQYEAFLRAFNLGSRSSRKELLTKCHEFTSSVTHTIVRNVNVEDSTGSYLANCQNCTECYFGKESRDCGYIIFCTNNRDCWVGFAADSELSHRAAPIGAFNTFGSYSIWGGEANHYSFSLYNNCSHCFGCSGLKKNSYCVLNKQYKKDEYMDLVGRIVRHMVSTGEWGQFLPPRISPHYYEESIARILLDDLPIAEAKRRGCRVGMPDDEAPAGKAVDASALPDDVAFVEVDHLAGAAVRCEESGQIFNLQRKELEIYKERRYPLPTVHWRRKLLAMQGTRDRMRGP